METDNNTYLVTCHSCGSKYLLTCLELGKPASKYFIEYCHYCGEESVSLKEYPRKEGS